MKLLYLPLVTFQISKVKSVETQVQIKERHEKYKNNSRYRKWIVNTYKVIIWKKKTLENIGTLPVFPLFVGRGYETSPPHTHFKRKMFCYNTSSFGNIQTTNIWVTHTLKKHKKKSGFACQILFPNARGRMPM